jgi:hypothetical protein
MIVYDSPILYKVLVGHFYFAGCGVFVLLFDLVLGLLGIGGPHLHDFEKTLHYAVYLFFCV